MYQYGKGADRLAFEIKPRWRIRRCVEPITAREGVIEVP
jgi:hypothetical protein